MRGCLTPERSQRISEQAIPESSFCVVCEKCGLVNFRKPVSMINYCDPDLPESVSRISGA